MPYFILYNKIDLMLLDYKGREAGQSSTFTICRQKKEENRWAREKKNSNRQHTYERTPAH